MGVQKSRKGKLPFLAPWPGWIVDQTVSMRKLAMNEVLEGMLLKQILLNAAYSTISVEIVEQDRIPFMGLNLRDLKEGMGCAKEPNSQK